ncbi:hypothetical protein [Streptosporangium minutum]|uniref:hypothetical protein n=1 Tax=Streptosporangium minutum TaxID=569862 RepID=UPI0013FDBF5D|nr:hypothetical protein [Streptosporangium minutum]
MHRIALIALLTITTLSAPVTSSAPAFASMAAGCDASTLLARPPFAPTDLGLLNT